MTRFRIANALVATNLLLLPALAGPARADTAAVKTTTGEVKFPVSCGAQAQKTFNQAVWTLHSFWYPEAVKGFTAVTEAEPGCAMGYWGIAMSHWYPLWFPPGPPP